MTTEMKLYQSDDLQVRLDVLVENETVWLSQKQMAILLEPLYQQFQNILKTSLNQESCKLIQLFPKWK